MTVKTNTRVVKSLDVEKRRATFVVLEPQPDDGTTSDLHGDRYSEEDVGGEVACKVSNLVFTTSSVTAVAAPETP